jgi:hypothetical protein
MLASSLWNEENATHNQREEQGGRIEPAQSKAPLIQRLVQKVADRRTERTG